MSEFWIWSTWLIKVSLYLSTAFMIGGAFCYFLLWRYTSIKPTLLKYIRLGAGLGLLASTLGFFILVGSFANTGLFGIFDQTYISILFKYCHWTNTHCQDHQLCFDFTAFNDQVSQRNHSYH